MKEEFVPSIETQVTDANQVELTDSLLKESEEYLAHLRQKLPADVQQAAWKILDAFPEKMPETMEERMKLLETIAQELLDQYDHKMLGGFSEKKVKQYHETKLCIPCFVQRPVEYPLYIQYLYCVRDPDMPHTAPYAEIADGVRGLPETEKERFLYELRLRFLHDVRYADWEVKDVLRRKQEPPEKFYEMLLKPDPEETPKEAERYRKMYERYVKLAYLGKRHRNLSVDDYMYELQKSVATANNYLETAFNEARLMRDLTYESGKTS